MVVVGDNDTMIDLANVDSNIHVEKKKKIKW